jgi:large subunit ribosomal protein L6
MSRVGKNPIIIPAGVEVKVATDSLRVKGPKGELVQQLHPNIKIEVKDQKVFVTVTDALNHKQNALWGLYRSLINNMVKGVTGGFEKKLEINGIGFKAQVSGQKLILNVGYSHPVNFDLPVGIAAAVEKNVITITGTDKQVVGEVAANIRKIKKPEPYLGKGIKYLEEVLRRKAGKAAGKTGE